MNKMFFVSVVLILLGNGIFCLPLFTAQQPKPHASASSKSKEVSAIQFQTFTSSQGRFTVSIPAGWELKSLAADESLISFTQKGLNIPEISIGCVDVSSNAGMIGLQNPRGFNQQWSANDVFRLFFIPNLQRSAPDLKIESLVSQNLQTAEAVISGSYQGIKGQGKIVCTMYHIQDPTLPPFGGWWSFAYLNSIVALPGEISRVEPIAAQIFQSFHPTERWMGEVMDAIYRGMEYRQGMIAGTLRRLNSMEMQQRMAEMQSMTKIGKGWIDTAGGMVEVKDPETGRSWRVNDQYKYYYESGEGICGTNDYKDLKLPGHNPLQK